MSRIPVRRAVLSVYDKDGLVDFARALAAAGVEMVSSGGTARALAEAGVSVTPVQDVTGAAEILGGRVKTLHPAIHGGILFDPAQPGHADDLAAAGIEPFQLVVSNLYPFRQTAADPDASASEVIEQIDIGGPAMIRAAAKNHRAVGVVTSPAQYAQVAAAVAGGGLDDDLRRMLAREAFFHTAQYDAAVVGWMERGEALPERMVLPMRRVEELRYGENPHQPAASYRDVGADAWWADALMLQGKQVSFNNLVDAEAAWRLAWEFPLPATVVVKHTNPCGVAEARDLVDSFTEAWECDPLSAFGSVIAVNRPLDAATAEEVAGRFVEVVVAPEVLPDAAAILEKRSDLRVLQAPWPLGRDADMRRIESGLLVQRRDRVSIDREAWVVATELHPTPEQWFALEFAWRVAAHTKSNAVVIAQGCNAVGVGAGDQSRVGAAERAVAKAGKRAQGAVAASDAFFPFRDGLDVLADAGVAAVIQPGGSKRDREVVAAAEERGLALVKTGIRHFRH